MAVGYNPRIVTDGLVLALDGANYKSFKGEATTNLIPNPTVNSYPTTGNGWGTYNTNQYNSNTYFSIGTISSVSNNIVTTSTNHPLRTYDVVRPQTTGGGVTSGTDYFVKKLSDTTFTLHAYNNSQDGSQGYISSTTGTHKVYDNIANDTRISINSTSFPTMWWGYPHLPNSGLVKELRYGEFDAIPGIGKKDCIRLHYIRTDNIKDGMAYGVNCTVTPSSPVTVSFYTRSANANAVGKQITYQIYNYTSPNSAGYSFSFTLGPVGVWQRQTYTFTPAYGTMISYWFPGGSGTYAWDWSCMQVEHKSYETNFVAGTRGTTVATGGGWKDLVGSNSGELVNGVRESTDSGGSLLFDGTDDYAETSSGMFNCNSNFTFNSWVNADVSDTYRTIISKRTAGSIQIRFNSSNQVQIVDNNVVNVGTFTGFTASASTWYNICVVRILNTYTLYVNGTSVSSFTNANTYTYDADTVGENASGSERWDGKISVISAYNRALSAEEIKQNFNAARGRFGI